MGGCSVVVDIWLHAYFCGVPVANDAPSRLQTRCSVPPMGHRIWDYSHANGGILVRDTSGRGAADQRLKPSVRDGLRKKNSYESVAPSPLQTPTHEKPGGVIVSVLAGGVVDDAGQTGPDLWTCDGDDRV